MAGAMVRRIDDMGRITLPRELHATLQWSDGDSLEMFLDDGRLVLRVYRPGCVFCDGVEDLRPLHGLRVCGQCAAAAASQIEAATPGA